MYKARDLPRYFLFLAFASVLALLATGCDMSRVKPQTPGQAVVDAYGLLEKSAVLTTQLLQTDVITVQQAIEWRDKIIAAKTALDSAQLALNRGDTSTAIGRLQAAQVILNILAEYVASHQGALPKPEPVPLLGQQATLPRIMS